MIMLCTPLCAGITGELVDSWNWYLPRVPKQPDVWLHVDDSDPADARAHPRQAGHRPPASHRRRSCVWAGFRGRSRLTLSVHVGPTKRLQPEGLWHRDCQWWVSLVFITSVKPKFHLTCHVTSRHDSTCSMCRAHAFWLCRAYRTARLDTLVSTRSTRHMSSHVEMWRDEPNGIWALRDRPHTFTVTANPASNHA